MFPDTPLRFRAKCLQRLRRPRAKPTGLIGVVYSLAALCSLASAAEPEKAAPNTLPQQASADAIRPLDVLVIRATDTVPGQPINGTFLVEPEGTVGIDPNCDRVKVAGMTCQQAEAAVRDELTVCGEQPRVYLSNAGPAKWRSGHAPPIPFHIRPQDVLQIRAEALPDEPIDGEYRVAADGSVFLGQIYGKAVVKGLTLPQAEKAISKVMVDFVRGPGALITFTGWETQQPVRPIPRVEVLAAAYLRSQTKISLPVYSLLAERKVVKQIGLTDRRHQDLVRLMAECDVEDFAKARREQLRESRESPNGPTTTGHDEDSRSEKRRRAALCKTVEAVLTPQQLRKLQDLSFPVLVAHSLYNPQVLNQIAERGSRKEVEEIVRRRDALDLEASRRRAEAAQNACDRCLALMTKTQRAQLRREWWRLTHATSSEAESTSATPSDDRGDRKAREDFPLFLMRSRDNDEQFASLLARDDDRRFADPDVLLACIAPCLTDPAVRKQLALSVEQEKRRQAIVDRFKTVIRTSRAEWERLPPESRDRWATGPKVRAAQADAEKAFLEILTPAQCEVAQDAVLRKQTAFLLVSPLVLQWISATWQQQIDFARIKVEMWKKATSIGQDTENKKEQILTAAQRRLLREIFARGDW